MEVNVQELVAGMLFWMQKYTQNFGRPPKMNDLYMEFQQHYLSIARTTNTNTGIVFAQCLDAVNDLGLAIRNATQTQLKEAEEAAKANIAPPPEKKRGRPKKSSESTPVVTDAPKRRGRPKKMETSSTYESIRKGAGIGRGGRRRKTT